MKMQERYSLSLMGVCGVYAIECLENGKLYIGSSGRIGSRVVQHYRSLVNGRHDNQRLQSDFNLLGADAFRLSIIEECASEDRVIREYAIIKQLTESKSSLYNYTRPKLRKIRSTPAKEKFRDLLKENTSMSYQQLADKIGINRTTLWRFVNTDYEPKATDLRRVLGLEIEPEIDYIRQVRNPNGTFGDRAG